MKDAGQKAMTEYTPPPRTRPGLAGDLSALGVAPGMTLIVHAALSRIGWVIGGAGAVIHALMDVLGPGGTLVMPTFSGALTDPASWRSPAVAPSGTRSSAPTCCLSIPRGHRRVRWARSPSNFAPGPVSTGATIP
jgi:hypothetical protein